MEKDQLPATPVEIRISALTLIKIAVGIAGVAFCIKLAPMALLIFLSILLAVTLSPILGWFERRNAPRSLGVAIIVIGMAGCLAVFLAVILPSIIDQLSEVVKDLPKYRDQMMATLPESSFLRRPLLKYLHGEGAPGTAQWLEKGLTAGQFVGGAVVEFLLMLIISVYLVVDGPRVIDFVAAFFSARNQIKLRQTGEEVSSVIFAYVAGQVITSLLVFFFTLIVLAVLHVPAALTLATLAGIFDVLPVLGFFLSAIPSILLALTVSPTTALIVAGYCVVYHAVENYLIVPKIYGTRLRLSTLAVLLSLLIADLIAGVPGAIAVLPVVASYSIIERYWLAPWLGRATLAQHAEQEKKS